MMVFVRTVWAVLSVIGVAIAVDTASEPVKTVSLSCSKVYDTYISGVTCETPIIEAFGIWPVLLLGILLATPPLIAAVAMRPWVSWTVVLGLAALAIAGLVNWTDFWGSLIVALPMAAIALVAAIAQQRSNPERD